ncbi:hypothetical protein FHR81_003201 [Actinoalloteichus hoggarensis]|uniref:Uncharacterized protein n=1 Tax=Actinoalloteichus hoggarensis TaxID=1470176 RepID=A0A221W6N2_9PSEU|nr:hypothetical protein [Actinoalloteichus hoggarensis]ASO21558.1 hypothetical protein AHOG_19700 [Actinoalloteichus hoggarensis]MBB5922149.1 hypothetical protein [Actinoalloteichus hoggarensis]
MTGTAGPAFFVVGVPLAAGLVVGHHRVAGQRPGPSSVVVALCGLSVPAVAVPMPQVSGERPVVLDRDCWTCVAVSEGRTSPPPCPLESGAVWLVQLTADRAPVSRRVVHGCPIPAATSPVLRARCGTPIPVSGIDIVGVGTGMPCGPCLGASLLSRTEHRPSVLSAAPTC